jgi:hypothetical protein
MRVTLSPIVGDASTQKSTAQQPTMALPQSSIKKSTAGACSCAGIVAGSILCWWVLIKIYLVFSQTQLFLF